MRSSNRIVICRELSVKHRSLSRKIALSAACACFCSWSLLALSVHNHVDGGTVRYPLVLLKGRIAGGSASLQAVNAVMSGAERELEGLVQGQRFKVLARLQPGENPLSLRAGAETLTLHLTYIPQTNPNRVRVIYVTDSSGDMEFQRPEDVSGDVKGRLQTAMRLMQTFTAESFHDAGMPRRTFNLEEDENGEVIVHVMTGDLAASDYQAMDGYALYSQLFRERDAKLPSRETRDLVIPAFTRFDPVTRKALAHTALGGGNFALFGSGNLFTWPASVGAIQSTFMDDRRIDPDHLFSDSVGRHTYWACASTTIGAALHELGHTFGLPHSAHPHDIMTRGHDRMNRFFTLVEPSHAARPTPYEFADDEVATWAPVSAQCLYFARHFALDEPPLPSAVPPVVHVDMTSMAIAFESDSGVGYVGVQTIDPRDGTRAYWPVAPSTAVPPPRRVTLAAAELGKRLGTMNIAFAVCDGTGRMTQTRLENLLNGPFVTGWHLATETLPWPDPSRFPGVSATDIRRLCDSAFETEMRDSGQPYVDLLAWVPASHQQSAAAYLCRKLKVGTQTEIRVGTGSDDALRLWFDDKVIREVLQLRAASPDSEWTTVSVAPGREHTLVAEVCQASGGWGLQLRLTEPDGRPLVLTEDGDVLSLDGSALARFRQVVTGLFVKSWQVAPEVVPWNSQGAFPVVPAAVFEQITEACERGQLLVASESGPVFDLAHHLPQGNRTGVIAYLHRRLVSASERRMTLLTGSDDALRVWLNGSIVREVLAMRGAVPDSERTSVTLAPGANHLVLEVAQGSGAWEVCLRIEDEEGHPLLLNEDGTLDPLP